MEVLTVTVLKYMDELMESTPAGAKEMLHLGIRYEVDQTPSRLVRRVELIRAGRGLYLLTCEKSFLGPIRRTQRKWWKRSPRSEASASHGTMAANQLGLTLGRMSRLRDPFVA